jgi:hypothetical protein
MVTGKNSAENQLKMLSGEGSMRVLEQYSLQADSTIGPS